MYRALGCVKFDSLPVADKLENMSESTDSQTGASWNGHLASGPPTDLMATLMATVHVFS